MKKGLAMTWKILVPAVSMLLILNGCETTSSSSSKLIGTPEAAWEGPVLISQAPIPESIEHKVIGTVEANAQVGYDNVMTLYPLLADEARKIGANAVVDVKGGRRFTGMSWAAAYVAGTAVRVDDRKKLDELPGTHH